MAITPMPNFTVRWTEPLGVVRTREHALEVDVHGESGRTPLRGSITADTADQLGSLPAGGRISSTRIVNDPGDVGAVESLWKQVKRDRIEQWLTPAEPGGRLDRRDIELTIRRGADKVETYRTDIERAPQPIQDLLASAASIHADVRMGH